jgi:hypothetical protein
LALELALAAAVAGAAGQAFVKTGGLGLAVAAEVVKDLGQQGQVVAAGQAPLLLLQLRLGPVEIID